MMMMRGFRCRCTCRHQYPAEQTHHPGRARHGRLARPGLRAPRRVVAGRGAARLTTLAGAVRLPRRSRPRSRPRSRGTRVSTPGAAVHDVLLAVADADAVVAVVAADGVARRGRRARSRPTRASANRRSLPGPPSVVSRPRLAKITSLPAPPSCVSSPGPPDMKSLPPWPSRRVVARRRRAAGRGRRRRSSVSLPRPPHRRSRLTRSPSLGDVADERVVPDAAAQAVRARRPCSASLPAWPEHAVEAGPPLTTSSPRAGAHDGRRRRAVVDAGRASGRAERSGRARAPPRDRRRSGATRRRTPVTTSAAPSLRGDQPLTIGHGAHLLAVRLTPSQTARRAPSCGASRACVARPAGWAPLLRRRRVLYCRRARGRSSVG